MCSTHAVTASLKCGPGHFHQYTIIILNASKSFIELWFPAYNQRKPIVDFQETFQLLEKLTNSLEILS